MAPPIRIPARPTPPRNSLHPDSHGLAHPHSRRSGDPHSAVLLFGFAGCTPAAEACIDDSECPAGLVCFQNACVSADTTPPPPSPPDSLTANARDDHRVSLRWTEADPAIADISFEIERTPEAGEPGEAVVFPVTANLSPTGAASETASVTDDTSDLQEHEGVTFIYRVRAVLGDQHSDFSPSDGISATVLPAAPNLVATPVRVNQIDLSWDASAHATEYSLERRDSGGAFGEIFRGANPTYSDPNCVEGTQYDYRVFAIVAADHGGVENNQRQDVSSAASAIASATIAFTAAFTAPPGTLINEVADVGFCVVQRLSQTLLTAGCTHQVRITLRGPLTGSLTLDRVFISQAAATGDPYDPAPDLKEVTSGVPVLIPLDTPVTVGPVTYVLDRTKDLLVAFDISNTPGEGNLRFGTLTGADVFSRAATAEAGVPDRTANYPGSAPGNLYLIEKIELL
jgi:hypothetical protein